MVLPHWRENQSHQDARAVPVLYDSAIPQGNAQRNRAGDWQGTGDAVCRSATDNPSLCWSKQDKVANFQVPVLGFPAENTLWMVWNNAKTPASLSVPRTLD